MSAPTLSIVSLEAFTEAVVGASFPAWCRIAGVVPRNDPIVAFWISMSQGRDIKVESSGHRPAACHDKRRARRDCQKRTLFTVFLPICVRLCTNIFFDFCLVDSNWIEVHCFSTDFAYLGFGDCLPISHLRPLRCHFRLRFHYCF